jgi:hypothetical protein
VTVILLLTLVLLGQAAPQAAVTGLPPLAGRPVADALRAVGARGLTIVFADDLVRPDMLVRSAPRGATLADVVEEILAPYGLTTRRRADGALVVVLRFETAVDVASSQREAPARQASAVPAIQVRETPGGLENVFHTLQLLPGVTGTSDFGSRQSVRGGGPDENLIVMDDIELHNPYRLFGLVSGVNPDTVQRFELFSGAFSAKYGDRLSSLLQIETRDGRRDKRLQGSINVSLTDANIVLEGALPKQRGSWLLTTRRTYYDLVAGRLSSEVRRYPSFTDVQAKLAWQLPAHWHVTVHALGSRESTDARPNEQAGTTAADFDGAALARTRTSMAAATLERPFGRRAVFRSTASASALTDTFELKANTCIDALRTNTPEPIGLCLIPPTVGHAVHVRDWTLRNTMTSAIGTHHVVDAGAQVRKAKSRLSLAAVGDNFPAISLPGLGMLSIGHLPWHLDNEPFESSVDGDAISGWLEDRFRASSRLQFVPGLRADYVASTGETLVAPRFAASLGLGAKTRLTGAAGVHYQSPGYDKAFLGGGAFALNLSSPQAAALRSERAAQGVIGIERDFARGLGVRVEAYARRLDRLIVGRIESESERAQRVATYHPQFDRGFLGDIPVDPLITSVPANDGSGHAAGVEVLATRKAGAADTRLTGWLSYTYANADRRVYGLVYPFDYDRRHAASAVAQFRVSPRLTASAAVQAASGLPLTLPAGARVAALPGNTPGGRPIVFPFETIYGPVYALDYGAMSRINAARLPATARLDVRATFGPRDAAGHWTFYVDVINVTNRRSQLSVFSQLGYNPLGPRPVVSNTFGGGFPILPTFGIRRRF